MKPPLSPSRSGAALVVVLSLLVLLTVLIVAFFTTVQGEVKSTANSKNLSSLRQLSDLPLNIVQTQIKAATNGGRSSSDTAPPAPTQPIDNWVSQPGLLRVYSQTGVLKKSFKLYSSSKLEEGNTMDFLASEVPGNWASRPNEYINLNEPFRSMTEKDPADNSKPKTIWPIFDPSIVDSAVGVSINNPPTSDFPAPMPVQWLYVLEDGSMVPNSALTADKPPVGRVAFWTDDESTKMNINTAGERTSWDRPRAWHTKYDVYAKNQPSTGEYNAYPGHPANVSLSAAFSKIFDGVSQTNVVNSMLTLTPRYRFGGSENMTRNIWTRADAWKPGNSLNVNKNERLYATSSEFLFDVARDVPNLAYLSGAKNDQFKTAIENSGFLLTESSRAPELNAFGLPRVGIWPVDTNSLKQTAYDQFIARCLTIGSKGYYFQRTSPTAKNEATAIPRNSQLLDYLDTLTKKEIQPSASFDTKWGTDERRQILTEIFDYVRAATNLSDTSRTTAEEPLQFTPGLHLNRGFVIPTEHSAWNTRGLGRAPVITHAAVIFYAYQQTNPVAGSKLASDYQTKVGAMLWFNFFNPMHGTAGTSLRYRLEIKPTDFAVKAPSSGSFIPFVWQGTSSDVFSFPRYKQNMDVGGYEAMPGFEQYSLTHLSTYNFVSSNYVDIEGDRFDFRGGPLEIEVFDDTSGVLMQTYTINFPSSTSSWPIPLIWTGEWDSTATTANFTLPPAPAGPSDPANPLNPYRILERNSTTSPRYVDGSGNKQYNEEIGRRGLARNPVDVIRTMEVIDGDGRIIAGLKDVPSEFFAPGEGYQNFQKLSGSLLRGSMSMPLPENTAAARVEDQYGKHLNLSFGTSRTGVKSAVLPKKFRGTVISSLRALNWSGDFDNGYLSVFDGPYANKPDEGYATDSDTTTPYNEGRSNLYENGERFRSWDPRVNGFFSPTRQVPSAGMFGSLPTTVKRNEAAYKASRYDEARPWETLLFSPVSLAETVQDSDNNYGHPGAQTPKDHFLLDLFTMPVVEPYAISEPFSTAGKINLNQRIIPFTYIERQTSLYGLFKNLDFVAIPNANASNYRYTGSSTNKIPAVYTVDAARTIAQFTDVLDAGGVGAGAFTSASQICDFPLIPTTGWSDKRTFWNNHQLTGDNTREMPYTILYPLLTTRSNTFQIHYRVQTLTPFKKRSNFDPKKDFEVTGEQRGSYLIERYLDSNDPRFQGATPTIDTDATPLNPFYEFRTLRHSRFIPGS